jgi:GTP-binding protein
MEANNGLSSLGDFYHKRHFSAQKGVTGGGSKCNGRKGQDTTILVPIGTLIYEIIKPLDLVESGVKQTPSLKLIADLNQHGERAMIAEGGIGGKGNSSFTSSVDQAPRIAEKGALGEDKEIFLELKSIADVGLVGLPNAGKSTLLAKTTNANPKIGAYPFTTIIPNVGVYTISPGRTFTFADIPGIIEGASEGKGLGFKFLRHIERCRLLLYLIDIDTKTPEECLKTLNVLLNEVKDYDEDLFARTTIICGNKIDTENGLKNISIVEEQFKTTGKPYFFISGKNGDNLDELCKYLYETIKTLPEIPLETETYELQTLKDHAVSVTIENGIYVVHCEKLERTIAGTDLGYAGSLRYVFRMFRKYHIDSILKFHGIKDDDLVELGGKRFQWF